MQKRNKTIVSNINLEKPLNSYIPLETRTNLAPFFPLVFRIFIFQRPQKNSNNREKIYVRDKNKIKTNKKCNCFNVVKW